MPEVGWPAVPVREHAATAAYSGGGGCSAENILAVNTAPTAGGACGATATAAATWCQVGAINTRVVVVVVIGVDVERFWFTVRNTETIFEPGNVEFFTEFKLWARSVFAVWSGLSFAGFRVAFFVSNWR